MHPERLQRAFVKIFTCAAQRVLPQAPNENVAFTVLVRMNAERKIVLLLQGFLSCALLSVCIFEVVLSLLSLVLDGFPFKIWKDLGGNLGSVLLSLVHPEHLTAVQWLCFGLVWSCVLIVASGIWLVFQAKRAFGELKLLRAFSQMDPSQIHDFPIGKYLRLSYPLWFHSELVDTPSPEVLLDVIKEREGLEDEWVARVVSTLSGEESAERKFLISLTHCVTFSPISALVALEPLVLPRAQAKLVGFLATHEKGTWIPKESIVFALYGENKNANLDQLRKRVNDFVSDYVCEKCPSLIDDEDKLNYKVEVIEFKVQGNRSFWRLSSVCDIAIFAEINRFHQSIHNAKLPQDNTPALSIEDLRVVYEQLKEVYKRGFLSEYFDRKNPMPRWVQQQYRKYRDCWIEILIYVIGRERELMEDPKYSGKERHKGGSSLAILYGQKALAAVAAVPHPPFGEDDLKHCLKFYKRQKNMGEAREVLGEYVRLRRGFDREWRVSDELRNIWPEPFNRIAYESNRT